MSLSRGLGSLASERAEGSCQIRSRLSTVLANPHSARYPGRSNIGQRLPTREGCDRERAYLLDGVFSSWRRTTSSEARRCRDAPVV